MLSGLSRMPSVVKSLVMLIAFVSTVNDLSAQLTPTQQRELVAAKASYEKAIALSSQQRFEEAAVHMAQVLEITKQVLGKGV